MGIKLRQAEVLHWSADREAVKRPECEILEPDRLMHRIVAEEADAGAADPGRFDLEVQRLADQRGLPEQAAIDLRPIREQSLLIARDHIEQEAVVVGTILAPGRLGCELPRIAGSQQSKRNLGRVAHRQVQAGREAVHAKVNGPRWMAGPRRCSPTGPDAALPPARRAASPAPACNKSARPPSQASRPRSCRIINEA